MQPHKYPQRGIPAHMYRATGPMPPHVAAGSSMSPHMGMGPQGMHPVHHPMHHAPYAEPPHMAGRPNIPPQFQRQPAYGFNGQFANRANFQTRFSPKYGHNENYPGKGIPKHLKRNSVNKSPAVLEAKTQENNENQATDANAIVPYQDKENCGELAKEAANSSAVEKTSKEKTPMCLVNELSRANKIEHEYNLISETGPAHCRKFYVQLILGDEEYFAYGNQIKKAQHAAAADALTKTKYPSPIPKIKPNSAGINGASSPTVELNALCMKLGLMPTYSGEATCKAAIELPLSGSGPRRFVGRGGYLPETIPYNRSLLAKTQTPPNDACKITLTIGERKFEGVGVSLHLARQNAAMKALSILKRENNDFLNAEQSEDKSPISKLHEEVTKRNLAIQFVVIDESGPPHMKTFITQCRVDQFVTEGTGKCKKTSKRNAAAKMLAEVEKFPPMPQKANAYHRRPNNRNVGGGGGAGRSYTTHNNNYGAAANQNYDIVAADAENPISTLIHMQQARRQPDPVYECIAVESDARTQYKEFTIECRCAGLSACGKGSSKKVAKRNAAQYLLEALKARNAENKLLRDRSVDSYRSQHRNRSMQRFNNLEQNNYSMRNAGKALPPPSKPHYHNGEETASSPTPIQDETVTNNNAPNVAAAPVAAAAPETKSTNTKYNELLYLGTQLEFNVALSDYPKGNHEDFLTILTLSTNPSSICHGTGPTAEDSLTDAATNAIEIVRGLGLMKNLTKNTQNKSK